MHWTQIAHIIAMIGFLIIGLVISDGRFLLLSAFLLGCYWMIYVPEHDNDDPPPTQFNPI